MRGYRVLKAAGRLDVFTDVGEAMTNVRFHQRRGVAPLIFGAAIDRAELVIRQYALNRVTRVTLNRSVLRSLGKRGSAIVHPLPAEWRAVLERHGFKVARIRSAFAWQGYVFLFWGYGILTIVQSVIRNLKAVRRSPREAHDLGRYAYFSSLAPDNLPHPANDGRSHDILTWYEQWAGRVGALDTLCHSVSGSRLINVNGIRVLAVSSALPPLDRLGSQLRFLVWGIAATVLAGADMLRGRWWHALLLAQASSAAVARMHQPDRLAQDYLFHVVGYLYRPLWTYEAERQGSRILLYNFSTNLETFKRPDGYPTQAHSWHAISWPICLVWDEGQADFFRRAVGDRADIQVVGPIWFSTSDKEMPPLPAGAVAVFDVQPHRASRYQVLGMADEFYTPKTVNQFLLDAHDAIRDSDGVMVLKRKRNIARLMHRHYAALVNRLSASAHVLTVEPATAAVRVVEHCQAVISMPFTSTALLGRAMGKPSIYYDPHGTVQRDDRAAHGIPIVIGSDELRRWVSAHVRPQREPMATRTP